MENELRWAAAGLLLAFAPIGLYHRLKARSGEPISRRAEGWPVLLSLRPIAACAAAGLLAYLINPEWMRWSSVPLPGWARWAGIPLGLASIAWGAWMFHTLGTNLTDTVVVRRAAYLVTSGPYRFVRHPMYVAMAGLGLAVSLLSANAFVAVCGAAVVALLAVRSRTEEANLVERFGDAYRDYARRTGRFWPRSGRGLSAGG